MSTPNLQNIPMRPDTGARVFPVAPVVNVDYSEIEHRVIEYRTPLIVQCPACNAIMGRMGSTGAPLWSCWTKTCQWFAQRRTLEEISQEVCS